MSMSGRKCEDLVISGCCVDWSRAPGEGGTGLFCTYAMGCTSCERLTSL